MGLGGETTRQGYNSFIGIEQETAFGTQVTATAYSEFYTESLKQNREVLKLESINTTRGGIRYLHGNEVVEGSLEMDLQADSDAQMWIIKQAFGGTVGISVISAGSSYIHTFNIGDMENNAGTSTATDVKSLTISKQVGDTSTAQWHFLGCRVNTLNINGEVGQPIKMSADIIGRTATQTSEVHTVAFPANDPLHFTGISITTGDTTTSLTQTSCIGFEFSLNNNLVNDNNTRELGSRLLKQLPPTNLEITTKLTMRFDTSTAYDNFMSEKPMSIKILMDSGVTIGAAGSSTYSMHIDIPKGYYDANPMPEVGEKGVIVQELEFTAIRENTISSYLCQMQVNNATANYF
jgi:hypothetical protein